MKTDKMDKYPTEIPSLMKYRALEVGYSDKNLVAIFFDQFLSRKIIANVCSLVVGSTSIVNDEEEKINFNILSVVFRSFRYDTGGTIVLYKIEGKIEEVDIPNVSPDVFFVRVRDEDSDKKFKEITCYPTLIIV